MKVSYFDKELRNVDVSTPTDGGNVSKQIKLTGSERLKTATFIINSAVFPARKMDHDITFKFIGDEVGLSLVRVIRVQ